MLTKNPNMAFPEKRLRRLRANEAIRSMVRETHMRTDDLVMPYFVCPGQQVRNPIPSMPGQFQLSIDLLVEECQLLVKHGVKAVLLFGIPEEKDETGEVAAHDEAIIPRAIRALKEELPELYIIADVCNCEYTTHGHCGTIVEGDVDNDQTLETLQAQAITFAHAGVDMVAPSDMMDGRIQAMRKALDENGYPNPPIMSYVAKYASAYYVPFRDAVESSPSFGDRKTY
jgi:porphobilinogen synthase